MTPSCHHKRPTPAITFFDRINRLRSKVKHCLLLLGFNMGPKTTDLKEIKDDLEEEMSIDREGDDNDDSVADSAATGEDATKNNSGSSMKDDKNVMRSKLAAFVILALAAIGLGLMTFFLTRGEELDDFKDQVSPKAKRRREVHCARENHDKILMDLLCLPVWRLCRGVD